MFAHLLPLNYQQEVVQWLKNDCPSLDIGGFVVGEQEEKSYLYCKESCVLAGTPFASAIFDYFGLTYTWKIDEGSYIDVIEMGDDKKRTVVAEITGKCRLLLLAERTVLNLISRASGVATAAYSAVKVKEKHNWHGFIAGTRKTTPGFGMIEKYSLLVGGAHTHRMDLSQMVMLKDNHVWSAGNITNAVKTARKAAGFSMKIEVKPFLLTVPDVSF
jgi:nicotinate-nucleotide pyrophosphorylase (carboxylating)